MNIVLPIKVCIIIEPVIEDISNDLKYQMDTISYSSKSAHHTIYNDDEG